MSASTSIGEPSPQNVINSVDFHFRGYQFYTQMKTTARIILPHQHKSVNLQGLDTNISPSL